MEEPKKLHRRAKAGPKLERKQKKQAHKNAAKNNPKAFAFNSGARAERSGRRNLDLAEKKLHVPLVDRTPIEAPPIVIAVVGPKGTGKSTLIRSLVKRYTKQSLNLVQGPITVVSGKNRRLTFIECNNDLNAMIDVAKVADLVLLMIDASFGFEMETFEFLNILQTHGFPRVMGVLTHIDKFKNNKKLRKTKKRLKQRFWTEIYQGAKLFYLTGVSNGKYPKREILNLSRFISVTKFRPLIWRNTHPYMLCDRLEDLTPPADLEKNPKIDRSVCLYGYLRGTVLKPQAKLHIAGVGDYYPESISVLPDPCPIPDRERKRLDERHRLLYAPMSDANGVTFDKDAVYIQIPGQSHHTTQGERLLSELQSASADLGTQIQASELSIFANSAPYRASDLAPNVSEDDSDSCQSDEDIVHSLESSEDDDSDTSLSGSDSDSEPESSNRRKVKRGTFAAHNLASGEPQTEDAAFAESDNEWELDTDMNPSNIQWKDKLGSQMMEPKLKSQDWMSKVYDQPDASESCSMSDDDGDEFLTLKRSGAPKHERSFLGESVKDSAKTLFPTGSLQHSDEFLDTLRQKFITGEVAKPAKNGEADSDASVYGDFEDLEERNSMNLSDEEQGDLIEPGVEEAERLALEKKKEELKAKFNAEYSGSDEETEESGGSKRDLDKNIYLKAKQEMEAQAQKNREAFLDDDPELRTLVEGHTPGMYVRVLFKGLPCEFVKYFDPTYPIVCGGLSSNETSYGWVQARIKRHRWYKKILKTNSPLLFSCGWRRFQSLPVYSLNDGTRNRLLKYTPEHMHCLASLFGPITPPGTGFCCFQSLSAEDLNKPYNEGFRVCATGVVLDVDASTAVVKKLKLVGTPKKIFKNTALIGDMFHSDLEVAKFEGSSIRTVSGIRGTVKKHVGSPPGLFRATFEDKILMSDIVFLRAWYPVRPKAYYNPVTSLLLQKKDSWKGMRTTGELRAILKKPANAEYTRDSVYQPSIERVDRKFNPLVIPKSLQKQLPFASKPKMLRSQRRKQKQTYMQQRKVEMEPAERKVTRLLQQLNTLKRSKEAKRHIKQREKRQEYLHKKKLQEDKVSGVLKQKRKEQYRQASLTKKAKA